VDRAFAVVHVDHSLRGLARRWVILSLGHYLVPRFVRDLFVGSFFVGSARGSLFVGLFVFVGVVRCAFCALFRWLYVGVFALCCLCGLFVRDSK
jgi:hypothetical protein